MANNPINLDIDDEKIIEELNKIAARGDDMKPIMAAISQIMVSSVMQNFKKQGRYKDAISVLGGNKSWTPLQQATILARVKRRKSSTTKSGKLSLKGKRMAATAKILIDRSIMKNSIRAYSTKDKAEVRTNAIQAATQHYGRDGIPSRPFMHIMQEDLEKIMKLIENYLQLNP